MNKLIRQFSDLPTENCLLCDKILTIRETSRTCPEFHFYYSLTVSCLFNIDAIYSFEYRFEENTINVSLISNGMLGDCFINGNISAFPLDFSNLSNLKNYLDKLANFL